MGRILLLVAVLPLASACGHAGNAAAVVAKAQNGLRHLGNRPVGLHVTVKTPIPIERRYELSGAELPTLDLTHWAKNPRRVACRGGLECARADLDVEAALGELKPLLPSLPIDPEDIRSATLDVAVERSGRPRYLHMHGDVHAGLLGSIPFEADLDVGS